MSHSISLTAEDRKTLLGYYRGRHDPELRLRAHIILLLAQGQTWATICAVLFCSSRTVARWKARFEEGGTDALLGRPKGPPRRLAAPCAAQVVDWARNFTRRAFGFLRSRWFCETFALLLWRLHGVDLSRETIRRRVSEADLVWRRPRPVL